MTENSTPAVVEYCVNNVTPPVREQLDSVGETRGYPCLERCSTCRASAFIVVDGELKERETGGGLVNELQEGNE